MRKPHPPEVKAAMLAAHWAQQLGIPPGNMWEPAIARSVLREYRRTDSWEFVEATWRVQLGVPTPE